ncbi:MAG TPA: bifunctional UDP-N-acetylglucosamine diphosphorylase/glucosamine-1-phosphate N-acetyltransferase GlmU [Jatrophihabitans sp.]
MNQGTVSAVVVLAAGEGTRMKSATLPKVLHGFAGRSLLQHVLAAAEPLQPEQLAVVVGHRREDVVAHLQDVAAHALAIDQPDQRGTGDAARLALESLAALEGTLLILPGDAPLLTTATLSSLVAAHCAAGAAATLLTSRLTDPNGYGRVIRTADGDVERIVEHRDATPAERAVNEVNTSVYAFDAALLRGALARITADNSQGEYYLTDVIGLLVGDGQRIAAYTVDAAETAGVNDRVQLAAAHRLFDDRRLRELMLAGVTIVDPLTTWVDADVQIEADAVLLPFTDLHGATSIAAGAVIGPQSSLTDTTVGPRSVLERTVARQAGVGADVTVGPFAYLRPGTVLADGVHVGTYVEIKGSSVGSGSKVPHLTYVGDAEIGEGSNIGASTVFVNYDGVSKHRTVVGDQVRIGSDTMLVAPVEIGDGAYTAAGSVITEDVPAGALGVSRAEQKNVKDWVLRRRAGTGSAQAAERAQQETGE